MGADTKTILCGNCKVPVEGPTDPNPNDTVRCPRCGITEKFHNVTREVGDFVKDYTADRLAKSAKRKFSGSKWVKVTTKPVQKRHYRFIVDTKGLDF